MACTWSYEVIFGTFGSKQDLEDAAEATMWSSTFEGYQWSPDFYRIGYRKLAPKKFAALETCAQFLDRRGKNIQETRWAKESFQSF